MGREQDSLHLTAVSQQEDEVQVLGELVGAYQLTTQQDLKDKHLRPYCIVKFQDKTIHYSSPCADCGRDPIWTVSTGSLFLINVTPSTLLRDMLQISVWSKKKSTYLREAVLLDMDTSFLGRASIDGQTLLSHCNEERLELPLQDLQGSDILCDSTLALRFRLATTSDIKLLNLLRDQGISPPKLLSDSSSFHRAESRLQQKNPMQDLILGEGTNLPFAPVVTEANETKLAGEYFVDALSFAFKPSSRFCQETGLRKVRVKPFPDPERVDETMYMTPLQISKETLAPSKRWVEAGSGSLGTLHLEILSCHGLPNVDVGEAVGNLSDCFVCAVFEDVMVQTQVIDDELSPHWLPWTQRAFRIGIVHPASTLFLAVLDYDLGPGTHEPIGRIAVNLNNLQSNMQYTLKYDLHPTSDLAERACNGQICIRLRIEYNDEKAVVLAALQPRPCFHVNTRKHKTFKVVRYTCFGEYDIEEQFNWAVTRSYIGEILEYWRALKFYSGECLWSLVFWRNGVEMHSAILFVSCATLIERPWLILPFYCIFAAWFMLAMMSHRRQTPSPWSTCNSFLHYAEKLVTGKSSSNRREHIRPTEFLSRTQAYENELREWKESYQNKLEEQWAMEEKLMTIGDENIQTEVAGQLVPLDLLERLGRYQGIIGRFILKLRKIKSVIIWEESATSFWLTAVCLSAGLVGLLLPWRFLLYHIGRIIVWGFLGPHMKLVDMYLQSSSQDGAQALEEFRKQSRLARIRREEAVKLKDMKCLAFGEYVTLVPSYNLPRHYDRPRHESFARYVPPGTTESNTKAISRIPGQQLYGSMIPHTKAGFVSMKEEAKRGESRLAALEEQVARLQSIEEHLSSRPSSARHIDRDLPDDFGYEITLCDDNAGTVQAPNRGVAARMPQDYGISLSWSETGFESCNETTEELSVYSPKSRGERLDLVTEGTAEEEKSWDMAPSSDLSQYAEAESEHMLVETVDTDVMRSCDGGETEDIVVETVETDVVRSCDGGEDETSDCHQSFADEVVDVNEVVSCLTPLQTHPEPGEREPDPSLLTPLQHYANDDEQEEEKEVASMGSEAYMTPVQDSNPEKKEMQFITPDQGSNHEQKTADSPILSPLTFLELKLREIGTSCNSRALMHTISSETSQHDRQINAPNWQEAGGILQSTRKSFSPTGEDNNNNNNSEEAKESHVSVRRTWSSSDIRTEKTWIKTSPTDSLLLQTNAMARRESSVTEMGLEIVAMGRLISVGDDDDEERHSEVDSNSNSGHRGLSVPYESSKYVQVATYRP